MRSQPLYSIVTIGLEMHFNASRSLTQPLLDCILYRTEYFYDPGTLPSSAKYPWESVSEIQSIKGTGMRLIYLWSVPRACNADLLAASLSVKSHLHTVCAHLHASYSCVLP